MELIAAWFTQEHVADMGYGLVFLFGTFGWFFICASAAIRSKHNPLESRWKYFAMNWDIYLVRLMTVDLACFMVFRHYSLADVLGFFGLSFHVPGGGGSVSGYFFAGLAADTMVSFALKSNKVPEFLRAWVRERIPEFPHDEEADSPAKP